MLGNLIGRRGFDYVTSEDVLDEFSAKSARSSPAAYRRGKRAQANGADAPADEIDIPMYSVDGLVRRATALQLTPAAKRAR